jgi:LytS/YehU family sensor histidine kinase
MDRTRAYWLCQVAGWSVVGAMGVVVHPENWASGEIQTTLFNWGLGVTTGIGVTHLFRSYAKRHGWARLPLRQLAPRIISATFLLGAAAVGVEEAATATELLEPLASSRSEAYGRRVVDSFLSASVLMGAWILIYFGVHAAWNYRQAEVNRWKLQARAETARLEALKLQLNPHFFFNSLTSVRSLISEAPKRAKKMVARLARLLRKTLRTSEKETVSLEEELATTETYLQLEQVRFEDRLSWEIDADEKALGLPVPHILVQTLVENAVKYGVAQRQGGGVIRVQATVADEMDGDEPVSDESESRGETPPFCIRVTNPGRLDEASSADRGSGTGLKNARERLRLLFGETASLTLEQSGPETVTATARLPRALGDSDNDRSEVRPDRKSAPSRADMPRGASRSSGAARDEGGTSFPGSPPDRPSAPLKRDVSNGGSDAVGDRSWTRLLIGRPSYWICQALGWGTLVVSMVVISELGESPTWTEILESVLRAGAFIVAAVGLTHAFRIYAKWQNWTVLSPRQLLPRAGAAAVLMGSSYVLITSPIALDLADLPAEWGPWLWAVLGQMAPPAFGFTIFMGLWVAIYFGVHAVWNRRQAEIDRWKLQARAETARLEALKLQLNPHFFFNSLASVRSLISEAPARAWKMVGRLARLLRRVLQASDKKTVPLRKELSTTRTYLELEKVRFEDRLDWTIDASEAALQRQVPYMLVQTLVENAVKHGIGQRRAGGTIRVEASVEDEESPLRLRVTNPGELGEAADTEPGSGTGLENARERLRLLFGEEASLTLEQSGPETVTATAQIPRPSALEDQLPEDRLPEGEAKRRASTSMLRDAAPAGTGSV